MTKKSHNLLIQSFFEVINRILEKSEISSQTASLVMTINTISNFPFLFDMLSDSGLNDGLSVVVIDSIKMLRPIELISRLNLDRVIIYVLFVVNISIFIYWFSCIIFFVVYYR